MQHDGPLDKHELTNLAEEKTPRECREQLLSGRS
jgi:hypothetical protein